MVDIVFDSYVYVYMYDMYGGDKRSLFDVESCRNVMWELRSDLTP